jgi:hypothetical protein
MNLRQFYTGRAIGFLILLGIIGLVAAFFSFNNYIYQEKQGGGTGVEPYRSTLSGEYVCLPHKDTTGPQTDECAFGLKTEVGEYYAVDFYLMSQEHQPMTPGDMISATGLVTPIERLNTDQWQKYPIEGIFSITDSLQVAE